MKDSCVDDCFDCVNFNSSVFEDEKILESANCSFCNVMNTYESGERIVKDGSPNFGVYCVRSGKVEVIFKNEGRENGNTILEAGGLIGMKNPLDRYLNFEAKAISDSTLCFYDREFVSSLLEDKGFAELYDKKCTYTQ